MLRAWFAEASSAAAIVQEQAKEADALQWYGQLLRDLKPHVGYVQRSGLEYFAALQEFVYHVLQEPVGYWALESSLGIHQRVLLWLTAQQRRNDVLLILADLQDNGTSYPTEVTAQTGAKCQRAAAPAYLQLLSEPLDPPLLRLTTVDLPVTARLTHFSWLDDGTLGVGGWAYLPGISPEDCILELGLRAKGSSIPSALAVSRNSDPRVDIAAGDRWQSYAGAAFVASVDPHGLVDSQQQPGGAKNWMIEVTLRSGEDAVSDLIRVRDAERVPRRLPVGPLAGGRTRVIGLVDKADGLRLQTVRYSCIASSLVVEGNAVTVALDKSGPAPVALFLERSEEPRQEFRRDSAGASFSLDLTSTVHDAADGDLEKRWTLQAELPTGKTEPVGWAGPGSDLAAASDPAAPLRAECTGYGYLQVALRPERLTLDRAAIGRDNKLTLEGRRSSTGRTSPLLPELLLVTARSEVRPSTTRWLDDRGRFRCEFPLAHDKWGLGEQALDAGHYRVRHLLTDESARVRQVPVPVLGQLQTELPIRTQLESINVELVGEGNEQDLVVRVSAPGTAAERTSLNRSHLITGYSRTVETVDPRIVLFETFEGKSCSDSGRAISDVMGAKLPGLLRYWTVADHSVPVPPNCTPVLRESPEWFRLLATAGYLVNNNNFPPYFRKRPEQFYLQTWHGTPLKRIGADTPAAGISASYRALLKREVAAWDMLLAQNDFAAETLAAAFGYPGKPEVLGYPRNDALTVDASSRRAECRIRLGIAEDRKVLLYMPTWRDNGSGADPYLDFEAAAEQLGSEYVLLYRGHHKIAGRRKTTGQNHYIDVTTHPEVNDLYLVADLLVTDYSSAMFDFSVTRKPMYFLTPDLARYRDSERGFYFDFQAQAPGPLASGTDELVAAVLSGKANEEPYTSRYRDFVYRYAPLDDGAAAARVVETVWSRQING